MAEKKLIVFLIFPYSGILPEFREEWWDRSPVGLVGRT